jgi:hypothetical protein
VSDPEAFRQAVIGGTLPPRRSSGNKRAGNDVSAELAECLEHAWLAVRLQKTAVRSRNCDPRTFGTTEVDTAKAEFGACITLVAQYEISRAFIPGVCRRHPDRR